MFLLVVSQNGERSLVCWSVAWLADHPQTLCRMPGLTVMHSGKSVIHCPVWWPRGLWDPSSLVGPELLFWCSWHYETGQNIVLFRFFAYLLCILLWIVWKRSSFLKRKIFNTSQVYSLVSPTLHDLSPSYLFFKSWVLCFIFPALWKCRKYNF